MPTLSALIGTSFIGVQGIQGPNGVQGIQGVQGPFSGLTGITIRRLGTQVGTGITNINFIGADITAVGTMSTITVAGELDITASLFS